MKTRIIKQIFFLAIVLYSMTSCTSITKLFPKQPRPFQAKEFNSEQWKAGDYQTRGEMAAKLREVITEYKNPWKKSADEVRQVLGEPDEIVKTECCYYGRIVSPEKVELWLYYLEIEEDYLHLRKESETKRKIIPQALKIYFPNNPVNYFYTVIGDRAEEHSVRMPVVGVLRSEEND